MIDIYFDLKGIKNSIFYKKQNGYIITKKIFNFVNKYSRGMYYENYILTLKYLKPYINYEGIDEVIEEFKTKYKMKKLSAKVFNQDVKKMIELINTVEPSQIHPAEGYLREVQLKELEFAKEILNDIYENTGLTPFMDDGTLLGAVRHGGFVPWDDDFDFSLMRKDYIKLEKYLLSKYPIVDTSNWTMKEYDEKYHNLNKLYPDTTFCLRSFSGFLVMKTTAEKVYAVDFFALDYYKDDYNIYSLNEFAKKMKTEYFKRTVLKDKFEFFKSELENNENIVEESNVIQAGIDNFDFYYYKMYGIRRPCDIFPLRKIKFEDTEFYAPNNPHEYLKTLYGNYKKLPLDIKIAIHTNGKTKEELLSIKE